MGCHQIVLPNKPRGIPRVDDRRVLAFIKLASIRIWPRANEVHALIRPTSVRQTYPAALTGGCRAVTEAAPKSRSKLARNASSASLIICSLSTCTGAS
jgi:hypothetical protein